MATGSSFLPRMHTPSHWLSWGQTRPQTAGRLFRSQTLRMDLVNSPSLISRMNAGMSTETGQPSMQVGFLHWRHRSASRTAVSSSNPRGTSSKFRLRTSGFCSGIFCLGIFSFLVFSAMMSSVTSFSGAF